MICQKEMNACVELKKSLNFIGNYILDQVQSTSIVINP